MCKKGCKTLKKRKGLTIGLLSASSVLMILFGRGHAERQEDRMLENSLYAQNSDMNWEDSMEEVVVETSSGEDPEESTEETSQHISSVVDALNASVAENGEATLAYYGNIDPESASYSELNNFIHNQTGDSVTVQNLTYVDVDSYDLYVNQTVANVVDVAPDMIFYGMPSLADKERDIGVGDTEEYLTSILETLTTSLPETEVVLVETHPLPAEMGNVNSRGLDYQSYMTTMNEVADSLDLPVLSVHAEFLSAVEESGSELSSFFQEDQVTLNDEGVSIYLDILQGQLSRSIEAYEAE